MAMLNKLTRLSWEGQWTSLWMLMRDWRVCNTYGKELTCRTRRLTASRTSWQLTMRLAKPCRSLRAQRGLRVRLLRHSKAITTRMFPRQKRKHCYALVESHLVRSTCESS